MFLKKFYKVYCGEESKVRLDFQLLDEARLLFPRFLIPTRSKRRLEFKHFQVLQKTKRFLTHYV